MTSKRTGTPAETGHDGCTAGSPAAAQLQALKQGPFAAREVPVTTDDHPCTAAQLSVNSRQVAHKLCNQGQLPAAIVSGGRIYTHGTSTQQHAEHASSVHAHIHKSGARKHSAVKQQQWSTSASAPKGMHALHPQGASELGR